MLVTDSLILAPWLACIPAVPPLTVGGRYAVTGQAARSLADPLPIADGLIARARGDGRARR